jgi:hypothetical protein
MTDKITQMINAIKAFYGRDVKEIDAYDFFYEIREISLSNFTELYDRMGRMTREKEVKEIIEKVKIYGEWATERGTYYSPEVFRYMQEKMSDKDEYKDLDTLDALLVLKNSVGVALICSYEDLV